MDIKGLIKTEVVLKLWETIHIIQQMGGLIKTEVVLKSAVVFSTLPASAPFNKNRSCIEIVGCIGLIKAVRV